MSPRHGPLYQNNQETSKLNFLLKSTRLSMRIPMRETANVMSFAFGHGDCTQTHG
jgi:hypothetical protein